MLNGEPREIEGEPSLFDLLAAAGYQGKRVAVEVNRRIVPRSTHAAVRVTEGDRIEIVHAIGGG
ncbi:sulfur carrier protein ThiS [Dokdonella immobilis]|uniref:Sulfur carrier protein ThiS n=2 Tax=Dokdonella immobilis TaxID=578942 RepID=A0A1I4YQC0_9GAMM|nr:sulfur carrier protein ThiS [Dokdonella immobilis]